MPQDTVPQFQSSGVFRKRHKYDINLPQPGRLFSTEKIPQPGRLFSTEKSGKIPLRYRNG
jgi:hypothetical protein